MLVVCRGESRLDEWTDPVTGEKEYLWDLDLYGFGDSSTAMTSGTNLNGTPCFDSNGRFNGKKIAPMSTYTNTSNGASPIMKYWNFENQQWGG